ncbi:hypothetical protein BaRGS_00035918 [Batillaria attramentaria]|uniref:Uncharacterized protein n=1 Tax=Batillaria attramentaria TaxID=370345 RepID=A0ABD0JD60_9CAEN
MKLRALPQSFWQQPNVPQQVSPATNFRVLPPLCNKDTEEDMTACNGASDVLTTHQNTANLIRLSIPRWISAANEVRPVTPPQDEDTEKWPAPERKITVANTDLLFKLFENIGDEKKAATLQLKRGRPKRAVVKSNTKGLLSGNDPYLVDAMADSLFPQLSIETSRHSGNTSLQLVTLGTGDKSVTLPSLTIEQNYPQMLSELVMHI